MGGSGTSRREVVTGAPRTSRPAPGPIAPARARPQDTALLRDLIRRQLRLGLAAFGMLAGSIGSLPLVFAALPDPAVRPGSALLVWAVLGAGAYPVLVGIGRWYVVRAERNERDALERDEGARR
ncbi:hypothetical protein [Streptomyces sp. WELS2]|uniref:hypothetical protein n=1 Tax=Streptomyces sp. WELS2 TaxID=2749435 RepID=UPI0015F08EB2|nr:hypothetical protein [Streptomyces sp. WELS2]